MLQVTVFVGVISVLHVNSVLQVADSTEFRAKNEGFLRGIAASYQLKQCDPRFSELRTYSDELDNR